MVVTFHHLICLTAIYATDANVLRRYTFFIAHGEKFYLESHKDLSQVPYFLIFFLAIYFSSLSYADDTTPYEAGGNSAYVTHNLEVSGNTLLNWFNDDSMKANPCKYHLLLFGNDSSKITVGNDTIYSSKCEKLLVIKIDSHLNFKEHIESLCKKSNLKN